MRIGEDGNGICSSKHFFPLLPPTYTAADTHPAAGRIIFLPSLLDNKSIFDVHLGGPLHPDSLPVPVKGACPGHQALWTDTAGECCTRASMLVCAVVMTRWDSDNSTIKTPPSPPNGAEDSDIRLSDRRLVCCRHVDCLRPACNISSEGNIQGLDGALLPKGAAIKTRTCCWRLFFVISSRGLKPLLQPMTARHRRNICQIVYDGSSVRSPTHHSEYICSSPVIKSHLRTR